MSRGYCTSRMGTMRTRKDAHLVRIFIRRSKKRDGGGPGTREFGIEGIVAAVFCSRPMSQVPRTSFILKMTSRAEADLCTRAPYRAGRLPLSPANPAPDRYRLPPSSSSGFRAHLACARPSTVSCVPVELFHGSYRRAHTAAGKSYAPASNGAPLGMQLNRRLSHYQSPVRNHLIAIFALTLRFLCPLAFYYASPVAPP